MREITLQRRPQRWRPAAGAHSSGSTSEMLTVSHPPGHNSPLCTSRRPLLTVSLSLPRQTLRPGLLGAAHMFVCLLSQLMAWHVAQCACSLQVKPARGGEIKQTTAKKRKKNSLEPFIAGGILLLLREERQKKLLLLVITRCDATLFSNCYLFQLCFDSHAGLLWVVTQYLA